MSREEWALAAQEGGREVKMRVEKISAITLRVQNMRASVRFYREVLGLEITYGGEEAYFSSLRTNDGKNPILNLEHGKPATEWGRLIFYVVDVDASWTYLKERGFDPRKATRRVMGRTVFPHARSRWPRAVVCASDLAVPQSLDDSG